MMMNSSRYSIYALLMVFLQSHPVLGNEDPSEVFSKSVIEEQQGDRFNYWNGTEGQPDGGMVIRFRFDATGDGKDDWLYKSSISPEDSWTLFVAEEEGFREAQGRVVSSVEPHVIDEGGARILTSIYSKPDFLGVIRSKVRKNGVVEIERIKAVEGFENVAEITSSDGWPEKLYGPIQEFREGEMTSLQSIVLGDAPQWKEMPKNVSLRSLHQQLDPRSRAELFGEKFTPKEAREALAIKEKLQVDASTPVEPNAENLGRSVPAIAGKSQGNAEDEEEKNDATAWPLVIGGIAVLGILLLLIRVFSRGRAS